MATLCPICEVLSIDDREGTIHIENCHECETLIDKAIIIQKEHITKTGKSITVYDVIDTLERRN